MNSVKRYDESPTESTSLDWIEGEQKENLLGRELGGFEHVIWPHRERQLAGTAIKVVDLSPVPHFGFSKTRFSDSQFYTRFEAFWALKDARDLAEAKILSDNLEAELKRLNRSAYDSYMEAKSNLLTIHELKLSKELKAFFSTTNPIESLNSLIEEDMRRVKHWKDSNHFQRWLATYCLNSEKRMRRVRGYRALPGLWVKIRSLTEHKQERIDSNEMVA